jgi:arylsulfatase A-like enzyme
MATLVALVAAPLAGLAGVGSRARIGRALGVVVAVCIIVHVAVWAAAFRPPEAVTASRLIRAVWRDAVQGGAGMALVVLAVSAVAARAVVSSRSATWTTAAASLAACLVAAAASTPNAAARTASAPPARSESPVAGYNVILLSIDSLRADHLGAYGYARATSPAIDALAKDGVLFRHNISTTSWTLPAHMSLLTARSLLGHGVVSDDRSLPESVGTVAEAFHKGGYETHAIVSAPYVHSRYGFARGFDDYDDRTIHFETNEDSYRSVTAPRLLDAAEAFLGQARAKPFFLFLHFWDVHYDYAPGAPYETMFDPGYTGTVTGDNFYFDAKINKDMNPRDLAHLVALYDGEIRLVDDHVARLGKALERLGIAERTIVAIVGDHGDEFFEHGNKGHHRTLYAEVLDTPFVLFVPGRQPARATIEDETSLVDVGPTLLGLAGLASPGGAEGRDFSGLYTGAPAGGGQPVFAELYRTGTRNVQVAEIDGRTKIIHHFQKRSLETYDLSRDAAEQHTLAADSSEAAALVARLQEWLEGRWHRFDKRVRSEGIHPVILDARTSEQLRSLGYLN